jgi:ParB family chromosome partitioning protein
MKTEYKIISLDRIRDPEVPLRSDLSAEAVADLVTSIKQIGIIEPLIVREKDNGFELIAGHRRLVAAEIAGLTEAPCIVREEKDMEAEILKLHENLSRQDINPIDWAKHLTLLKKQYNLTSAKLAELLGMSEGWVEQHLGILSWPKEVFEALETNQIVFSAGRELAFIKDPVKRNVYTTAAVKGGVTPALAAQWRKEANREAPGSTPINTEETNPEEEQPPATSLPICPVCGKAIPLEEVTILQVHIKCQPPKAT